MTSQEDYYDPEVDVRPSSPGLVATQINYKPEESPPPYIPSPSSSGSVSPEPDTKTNHQEGHTESPRFPAKKQPKRKKRRKGRTRPSQGDAVLISYLDPNRPDIAREVAQHALNSASQSEAEEETEKDMSGDGGDEEEDNDDGTKNKRRNNPQTTELTTKAQAALHDVLMDDPAPEQQVVSASLAMHGAVNGTTKEHSLVNDAATLHVSLHALQNREAPFKSLCPPLPLKIEPSFPEGKREIEDESITTSPALAKFTISAAEANPNSTLPAIQKSPPRSMSSHSPEGVQNLPSLQTTLGQIVGTPIADPPNATSPFPQILGQSPIVTRPQHMAAGPGPSPIGYSHPSPASSKDMTTMSPPGYPSHPSLWRSPPKEGSLGTISPPASVPGLTPSTSYPSPTENTSPESSTTPQSLNGALLTTTTAFKCTHPGCTAPPFQTQYLLNSHANVHSSNRPHYCPVKSCPRSVSGRGFKRKNEMIRHGLVHDSPGYVCPFCADQQHKYPRPDNLQRHVRVHHPDKERDDPQLRSVLALRSGDGSRGRRRRTGT
ncbi:hypothetical protein GJ744_004025 [Endocarpon pusillum]|uniref:C2H2-type domain-containing protein n=1 Tax=Endocarpon pusillum TaxID=364733 RepID=A0A8H7A8V1_9EURO|nr:hypothetical protein GJ744_004025 [Endocarpon pusillum]